MKRKIAIIFAVLAVISMFYPAREYGATEIGFSPGDPDPNLYQKMLSLGWPFPWIDFVHNRRESDGLDESRLRGVFPWNLMIHLGMLLIPFWIEPAFWRRKRNSSKC